MTLFIEVKPKDENKNKFRFEKPAFSVNSNYSSIFYHDNPYYALPNST